MGDCQRIILGITGATGMLYVPALLQLLAQLFGKGRETAAECHIQLYGGSLATRAPAAARTAATRSAEASTR